MNTNINDVFLTTFVMELLLISKRSEGRTFDCSRGKLNY